MKKLTLIRHAKSSWRHNVIDHERPLNDRGLNDSDIVSNHLKINSFKIDKILSSDAVRAKTTADTFVLNLGIDKNLMSLNHHLYDFSGHNLVKTIKEIDASINCLIFLTVVSVPP